MSHTVPIHDPLLRLRTAGRPLQRRRSLAPALIALAVRAGEFTMLVLLGTIVATGWVGVDETFESSRYITAFAATALVAVLAAQRFDLHTLSSLAAPLRNAPRLLMAWTVAMGLLLAAVFLLKAGPEFSRGWILIWYGAGAGGLLALRGLVAAGVRRLQKSGALKRVAVIYGAGPSGQTLAAAIDGDPDSDVGIAGIFDDRGDDRVARTVGGYRRLGNIDELIAFCRSNAVDLLIVALPITAETRLLEILKKLWVLPIDIRLAAHGSKLRFRPRAYSWLGGVPLIDLFDKPLSEWDGLVKTGFDRCVALIALVLLAPLMMLVAVAIRIESRGPVLFRQRRLGFNNELIEVLKFRSLHHGSSDALARNLVTRNDPRVTRVGRFIRRTSIDELPQLFNVLKGDLSLVGPRPHALEAKASDRLYHEVVDGYFARHKVKPGITGWAQVNGWRGETDTHEKIMKRVEHDLYYIENWSLLLDVYILVRTPLALLDTRSAY